MSVDNWDGAPIAKGKIPAGSANAVPVSPAIPVSDIPVTPALPVHDIPDDDDWGIDVPVANAGTAIPVMPEPAIPAPVHQVKTSPAVPRGVVIPAAQIFSDEDSGEVDSDDWGIDVPQAHAPVPPVTMPVVESPAVVLPAMVAPVPVVSTPVPTHLLSGDDEMDTSDDRVVSTPPKSTAPKTVKGDSKKKTKPKTKALGGIRMTPRDFQILAFLARYRTATVGQLARRFETSETALRNRLPALERAGLIGWAWAAQTKPKVWFVTDQGLKTVGMNLTAPKVSWGQLRHTLGLVDLGTAFELAGEKVLTEREIRAAATRYTPTARIKTAVEFLPNFQQLEATSEDAIAEAVKRGLVVPVPGRGFGHIPDMVLARRPYPNGMSGSIAVELELTRKGTAEWKTILTAFRDSAAFDQVYYYVTGADVKRGLEGVIKAIGAADKIHVEKFVPVDLTADPGVTGGGI